MNPITTEAAGFQQTQTTRAKDPGPAQDANPPPPPPKAVPATSESTASPHPYRGHNLNAVV